MAPDRADQHRGGVGGIVRYAPPNGRPAAGRQVRSTALTESRALNE